MSLQSDVEEFIRPLVTALCESSEEIMEVDSAPVSVIEQEQDADSDIAVMACNREAPVYPPQLAGGRAMTFDLDTCGEERARCPYGQAGLIGSTFDPSDSLVDWFVGSPPTRTYTAGDPEHHIANCSQLEPKPYSPMSPPLIYQGHQELPAMTSGQKIYNGSILERPIRGKIACAENRLQLYKKQSPLGISNKPTSRKKTLRSEFGGGNFSQQA